MMRRFALLASLTAAAGCLGGGDDDDSVSQSTEEPIDFSTRSTLIMDEHQH